MDGQSVSLLCGHQRDPKDPGVIHPRLGLHERDVVADIVRRAAGLLKATALPVLVLPTDVRTPAEEGKGIPYSTQMARAAHAVADHRMVILHVHCDSSGRPGVGAGPHQDRLVFYDHRSAWGKAGAEGIARSVVPVSAGIRRVRAEVARPSLDRDHDGTISAEEYEWRSRAFGCLTSAYDLANAYALLIELGNFAAPEHDGLWVGRGLDACALWLANVSLELAGCATGNVAQEATLCPPRHP